MVLTAFVIIVICLILFFVYNKITKESFIEKDDDANIEALLKKHRRAEQLNKEVNEEVSSTEKILSKIKNKK